MTPQDGALPAEQEGIGAGTTPEQLSDWLRHHRIEEVGIVVGVAVGHVALSMQIRRKYARSLKSGSILYDVLVALANLHTSLKRLFRK